MDALYWENKYYDAKDEIEHLNAEIRSLEIEVQSAAREAYQEGYEEGVSAGSEHGGDY